METKRPGLLSKISNTGIVDRFQISGTLCATTMTKARIIMKKKHSELARIAENF